MRLAKDAKVIVIGAGITGQSAVRFARQFSPYVAVYDTREAPTAANDLIALLGADNCFFAKLPEAFIKQADVAIVSPGLAPDAPIYTLLQQADVPTVSDISLFAAYAPAPIIGITGTNGKSTVTTLVAELINASGKRALAGGNLGTAALDLLAEPRPDYYVTELSSFQLDLSPQLPLHIACLLNVSPDHLDRYPDFAAYCASKQQIFAQAKHAVYNADDPLTQPARQLPATTFAIKQQADFYWQDGALYHQQQRLCGMKDFRLQGKQHAANALAALAIIAPLQLPQAEKILAALQNFSGLRHRCEWVAEINGVTFYNDSKATNVGATVAAIEGLAQATANIHLLAGGQAKSADLSALTPALKSHVKHSYLFGEDAQRLAAVMPDDSAYEFNTDLAEALIAAQQAAVPGDIILLSPACASFDMYANFEARGEHFKTLVQGDSTHADA